MYFRVTHQDSLFRPPPNSTDYPNTMANPAPSFNQAGSFDVINTPNFDNHFDGNVQRVPVYQHPSSFEHFTQNAQPKQEVIQPVVVIAR